MQHAGGATCRTPGAPPTKTADSLFVNKKQVDAGPVACSADITGINTLLLLLLLLLT
jgi:hypothetical protein